MANLKGALGRLVEHRRESMEFSYYLPCYLAYRLLAGERAGLTYEEFLLQLPEFEHCIPQDDEDFDEDEECDDEADSELDEAP